MHGQLKQKGSFFIWIGRVAAVICVCAAMAAAASPEDSTPQGVFDAMRGSFQPTKAKGVHARYQWDLSGPNGGGLGVDVNDGTYEKGKGKYDHPDDTIIAKDKDWVSICHEELSGTWAFMTGRLKVRGDHGVARKLGEMFP